MSVRLPLLTRPRFVLSLLVGLLTLAACEGARNSLAGPDGGRLYPDAGPHRVVAAGQQAHFYIGAFVDDWPLFMGDRVPGSLATASQVVFVFTNSGDKNLGMAYVQTRETGGAASIDSVLKLSGAWTCGTSVVQGHPVRRCTKGPAVAYYLRLPDGAPTGEGYGTRGSMAVFRDGGRATLTAIDNSTTYASWGDLVSTVRSIVDVEGANQSAPMIEVNSFEYDRTINVRDHTDHAATADLVYAASATRSWNINWYVGFAAQNFAVNLTQAQHDVKMSAFYGYDEVVGGAGYGHPKYDSDIQLLLWRTYFRSVISVPAPPPAAPSGLTATAISSTRTDLAWTNNATGAINVDVELAPDVAGAPGTFGTVATVAATATTYSVTGLQANTRYWYRVRARNGTDVSDYSTSASATTLVPPAAPTALAATPFSSTRIDLAWTDNATGETGVAVERAPDNAGVPGIFTVITTTAANAVSYSSSGLAANTRYWYRVRAMVGTDPSAYSNVAGGQTLVAPAVPTGLVATAVGAQRIDLAWTDSDSETTYTLGRAPDNNGAPGTYATIASPAANVTSYSDQSTSLVSGARYWYRLRINTATDASPYTAGVSATTLATAPTAPTTLVASTVSGTRVDLSWADRSSNETGFIVERAVDAGGVAGPYTVLLTTAANVVTYSNTDLVSSTRYWYRVRATNAVGPSAYTNEASATTLAANAQLTDFYIHAHADDWQLFMGEKANASLKSASKVVFVYTSAGDANQGTAYWQLRETAAQNSIDALYAGTGWTCGVQTVNSHALRRCVRGIAVSYYFRMPDGAVSGEGFGGRGSIAQLRDGIRSSLTAIDGSTTYTSWADFSATIGAVIDLESGNATSPAVQVHAPEYDRAINPSDHSDHYATADAVRAASLTHTWTLDWYIDYRIKNLATNLTQAAHDIKQSAFYAYDFTIGRAGYGYSQFESDYQAWLWRSYSRRVVP
jgi:GlcNAc-PI de-N-acetylase/Fibronectin type III domain